MRLVLHGSSCTQDTSLLGKTSNGCDEVMDWSTSSLFVAMLLQTGGLFPAARAQDDQLNETSQH